MSAKEVLMAAAGGTADVTYVEDVFSTYLYDGNGGLQPITNGIDLAGQGGLVWTKIRGSTTNGHRWVATPLGTVSLDSSNADPLGVVAAFQSFDVSGYTLNGAGAALNGTGNIYASWTFRKAPKFFDALTYTGTGVNRTIAHDLGSVPGCIIVKRTDVAAAWQVYHRSLANTEYLVLNSTAAKATGTTRWNSTTPTSTGFRVGTDVTVNASGGTYVAYLFAHDAGGFGLTGTDNVISCGSFTTDGSGNATVNLGWEPQWVMCKASSGTGAVSNWITFDSMRNMVAGGGGNSSWLYPNTSDAEVSTAAYAIKPNATGMTPLQEASTTYIYIAIRRPNKPPTTGTQVFSPNAVNVSTGTAITTNFPIDLQIFSLRTGTTNKNNVYDRLRGISSNTTESGVRLITSSTAAGTAAGNETLGWDNTGFKMTSVFSGTSDIFWNFRRAPGFFDEVCYTGNSSTVPGGDVSISHGLGVPPELAIVKIRGTIGAWAVGNASDWNKTLVLNETSAYYTGASNQAFTAPTASVLNVRNNNVSSLNANTYAYVAYLFATLPGISKVFSYTGNGSSQTINCGFTTGARFVLIKRTDVAGDWYIWDSARGIVAGNDPHLSPNTTAAEVTSDDSVDTDTIGFIVNQLAATNVNVTSATYIGLAIA